VIVDANLRNGDAHASATLSEVLQANGPSPESARVPARIDMGSTQEISRIPVGARVGSLLNDLRREYDVVLIDTPPLRLSADTEFLASISDITLVVVEAGKATRRELVQGTALLGQIGTPSIGVIMSRVRMRRAGSALKRDFKHFSSLSWSAVPDSTQG
jgi:polysaccharide biosynthesis transport protein